MHGTYGRSIDTCPSAETTLDAACCKPGARAYSLFQLARINWLNGTVLATIGTERVKIGRLWHDDAI